MTVCPRHRMNTIESFREERVLIEGSSADRTILETLKQVKRDDFVFLKTAIENQQRNSFFSSVTCFSSDMKKQTLIHQPSEVEISFKEYTRAIMNVKYKTFLLMNIILCPIKSYWELATRTRLTTTVWDAILMIADFVVFKFPIELWDQNVQNSTSQHDDDGRGKTRFPETDKNVRSCEREIKIEERDQLHL